MQNYISTMDVLGNRFTSFTPLEPYVTPTTMQENWDEYNRAFGESKVDPLPIIPVFMHDFLCIHPFLDGNGRMSRWLTNLLLYLSGYEKYISLETKIAKTILWRFEECVWELVGIERWYYWIHKVFDWNYFFLHIVIFTIAFVLWVQLRMKL